MLVLQRKVREKIEITHLKSGEKLTIWMRSMALVAQSASICLEGPLGEFDIQRIERKLRRNRSDIAPDSVEEDP